MVELKLESKIKINYKYLGDEVFLGRHRYLRQSSC